MGIHHMPSSPPLTQWRFELYKHLPMLTRLGVIVLASLVVGSLVLYGVSVYMESQLVTLGKETRQLREDNQDRQIQLDRIRSFEHVGDASHHVQGLHVPSDLVDVAASPKKHFKKPAEPAQKIPKGIYGY